jgi:hypothetical protein
LAPLASATLAEGITGDAAATVAIAAAIAAATAAATAAAAAGKAATEEAATVVATTHTKAPTVTLRFVHALSKCLIH